AAVLVRVRVRVARVGVVLVRVVVLGVRLAVATAAGHGFHALLHLRGRDVLEVLAEAPADALGVDDAARPVAVELVLGRPLALAAGGEGALVGLVDVADIDVHGERAGAELLRRLRLPLRVRRAHHDVLALVDDLAVHDDAARAFHGDAGLEAERLDVEVHRLADVLDAEVDVGPGAAFRHELVLRRRRRLRGRLLGRSLLGRSLLGRRLLRRRLLRGLRLLLLAL